MDRVLRGAEGFSDAFLDNIAVFSDNWEEHIQHLREVLTRLRAARSSVDGKAQEDRPRHATDYSVGLHCGERREDSGSGQDGGHS